MITKRSAVSAISRFLEVLRAGTRRVIPTIDLFPTRLTRRAELEALLSRLHPVATSQTLVRLGPQADGGYLVPDDFDGIEALFSPGVDQISGFEKDCADLGMKVYMADRSVERPAVEHELFSFSQKNLGVVGDESTLTLDGWVTESVPASSSDLMLQIDIEGSEYEVFLGASDELMARFRIIVAEFHHLDLFFSRPYFALASRSFEKILRTHDCVHIHPNNSRGSVRARGIEMPKIAEFTFVRRDRFERVGFVTQFPHALDDDNTGERHLALSKSLYRSRRPGLRRTVRAASDAQCR